MARRLEGRVVIATHNPGKLREMRELLAPYGINAVSAGDLDLAEPEETGTTFAENARIKAEAAARATALPAFADDSGLTVEALGGEPGIHSARSPAPTRISRAPCVRSRSGFRAQARRVRTSGRRHSSPRFR
jgi:XTP/dITP diphosphohydrolase